MSKSKNAMYLCPQAMTVREILTKKGSLTTSQGYQRGIAKLSARISELRTLGMNILTEKATPKRPSTKYTLVR